MHAKLCLHANVEVILHTKSLIRPGSEQSEFFTYTLLKLNRRELVQEVDIVY